MSQYISGRDGTKSSVPCGSPARKLCDFVCDCPDCSDENQCGYHKESATLGTPFTCDFEDGKCGWTDVSTSAYRWVPERAGVADHTGSIDLGWFMAAEMHRSMFAAVARLRSPVMRDAAATCEIHAWYHLAQPGLWVELTKATETITLWQSPGSSVHAWRELTAYTGRVSGEFQVRLNQLPAALSLAERVVSRGSPTRWPCSRGSCVPLEQLCDGTDDCGDRSDESALECGECPVASWGQRAAEPLNAAGKEPASVCLWKPEVDGSQGGSQVPRELGAGRAQHSWSIRLFRVQLIFYSHLSGSAASSLNVYYQTQGATQLVRARAGDRGHYWFREKVDFHVTENFQVGSMGLEPGPSVPGTPLPPCVGPRHAFPPVRRAPRHVPGTRSHCGQGGLAGPRAKLCSPPAPPSFSPCRPGQARHGAGTRGAEHAGCIRFVWLPRLPSQDSCQQLGLLAPGYFGADFYGSWLAFEALHDGHLGDMALDDITVRAGACGPQESCSFEANTCGFSSSGQYPWARQSRGSSAAAGPPTDHTSGTARGYYMIVDTSQGSLPRGQVATLSSAPYRPRTHPQCLVFWYQLSGSDPGELPAPLLFPTRAGQWGGTASWRYGRVTVRAAEDWQVSFEVLGAGGSLSYVALDDVHLKDSSCPEPGACDFELDMCGWTRPSDPDWGSYAWGWRNGASPSNAPGPVADHTLGTVAGRYAYFDTSVLGPGDNAAWLLSEHLPATTGACLRFWYHMDFAEHFSSGELRVKLHSMVGQLTLWSARGHQGQGWQPRTVPVQSTVEFQVTAGACMGLLPLPRQRVRWVASRRQQRRG
uniref:MAM domain containing 4 n=1 Tax=Pelusios castaneus TaxID=367368 RepID=A0A8C8RHU5_9SAUR